MTEKLMRAGVSGHGQGNRATTPPAQGLINSNSTAARLGISTEYVRQLVRRGVLRPHGGRPGSGRHLWFPETVVSELARQQRHGVPISVAALRISQ